MNGTKQAIVLKVRDRFYSTHNYNRVTTSWSLAGSKLFLEDTELKISNIEEVLKKKGYIPIRKIVKVVDGIFDNSLIASGWLETNKILPAIDQWCFFWVGLSKPMICNYKGHGKFLCTEDNDFWIISEDYISHWMPCPSPPAS
jgi:hypothetical protein